jgi:serine O-acetyltransferase
MLQNIRKETMGGSARLLAKNVNASHEKIRNLIPFSQVISNIREDANMVTENDPALKYTYELVLYLGLWAVITYRFANYIYMHYDLHFAAKLMLLIARILTGVEIHPAANIGPGLFIDHGCGVVIGETAIIGSNCILFHGCTLGGTGKELGKRHPTIGDRVVVGAGAKVLGNITLGNDVKIGAGSVVVKSATDNCTIVGIPGRAIPRDTADEREMIRKEQIPDVDAQAIRALYRRNLQLENDLADLREQFPEIASSPLKPKKTEMEISDELYLSLLTHRDNMMLFADGI